MSNPIYDCKSRCIECQNYSYNKGYKNEDNIHRICSQCSENRRIGRVCPHCKQNVIWERKLGSVAIWERWIHTEARGYCNSCINQALLKLKTCGHGLCIRCAQKALIKSVDKVELCYCKEKYPKEDVMNYLASSNAVLNLRYTPQKVDFINTWKFCSWCSKTARERAVYLSCKHVICYDCMMNSLEQVEPKYSLLVDNELTRIYLCPDRYCQTWITYDDIRYIGETIREKELLLEENAMNKSLLKTPEHGQICDDCSYRPQKEKRKIEEDSMNKSLLRHPEDNQICNNCTERALIELGCGHKYCCICIQAVFDTETLKTIPQDGNTFNLKKCRTPLCEYLVCEEHVKEWIDEEECKFIGRIVCAPTTSSICSRRHRHNIPAKGELPCGHRFCENCLLDLSRLPQHKYTFYFYPLDAVECPVPYKCGQRIPVQTVKQFLVECKHPKGQESDADTNVVKNDTLNETMDSNEKIRVSKIKEKNTEEASDCSMKGISNLGATCYGNSILQVLAQTPEFLVRLKENISTIKKKRDVFHGLFQVLKDINENGIDGGIVDYRMTRSLWHNIFAMDSDIDPYIQNDSHSFIMSLFNLIAESCENHGPIALFEGELQNEFQFHPCNHTETSTQLFRSISVPVFADKDEIFSVKNGLDELLAKEDFKDGQLPCRRCYKNEYENTSATKELKLNRLPRILLLQLGRAKEWSYSDSEMKGLYKGNDYVYYTQVLPVANLNPTKGCSILDQGSKHVHQNCTKDFEYSLYAVVMHIGSLRGGHYYSYVKNRNTQQWFYCNDTWVTKVKGPPQEYDRAYLLFYELQPIRATL